MNALESRDPKLYDSNGNLRPLSERVVLCARAAVSLGDHDPAHRDFLGGHEGPHHVATVAGVLRSAGIVEPLPSAEALVSYAMKCGAWVEAKGPGAKLKPEAGDIVVVGYGKHNEHAYIVCSISQHHLESLDGGQFGSDEIVKVDPESGTEHRFRGGLTTDRLVELKSRQWQTITPRDKDGKRIGPDYIVDSAFHGLEERRHPPRTVLGWMSVAKVADPMATTKKEKAA